MAMDASLCMEVTSLPQLCDITTTQSDAPIAVRHPALPPLMAGLKAASLQSFPSGFAIGQL